MGCCCSDGNSKCHDYPYAKYLSKNEFIETYEKSVASIFQNSNNIAICKIILVFSHRLEYQVSQ